MRKLLLLAVLSFLYCGVFANRTKSYDEIIDIKVYDPVLRSNHFSSSIKKALKTLYSSNDSNVTCIVNNYISNGSEFHLSQLCSQISNKCHNNFEINNELLEQLEEISLFIKKFNSAFSHCSQVFSENSSALSGYYTIRAPNGSLISVYCDMEGSNCDCKGGWMRVGYLNMSEPGAKCLPGLKQRQYTNIDHDVCGLPNSGTFSHTFFSTQGIHYNKVCGQLSGYQYRAPDGFNGKNFTIDSCYVDGISITYGNSPRKHIWTYANGLTSDNAPYPEYRCSCNTNNTKAPGKKPNFVGNDYYCESAIPPYVSGNKERWQNVLYVNDTLWDGRQCDGNEGPCCTNPKMPWFIKALNVITNEDIELRVCGNEAYPDEDTPLDFIELYIK